MHTQFLVNIVNLMSNFVKLKEKKWLSPKSEEENQFSKKGLYVREDDQDWGSAGMNDVQTDSE